jgi:hypothetical protein
MVVPAQDAVVLFVVNAGIGLSDQVSGGYSGDDDLFHE